MVPLFAHFRHLDFGHLIVTSTFPRPRHRVEHYGIAHLTFADSTALKLKQQWSRDIVEAA